MSTIDGIIQALHHLPDDFPVQLTIPAGELREAMKARDGNPDRLVGTTWASETLGMSREWWTGHASEVPGAFQEGEGKPWRFTERAARAHLTRYIHRHSNGSGGLRGPRRQTKPATPPAP